MKSTYLASFGRRRGRRFRSKKQRLMDELLPQVQIALPDSKTHPAEFFPSSLRAEGEAIQSGLPRRFVPRNDTKYWLEIGFGTGAHLAHQARLHPAVGFIGCEPYMHGIGDLLKEMEEGKLHNIRIYNGDARLLMEKLPDACLDKVFILYPDPWPKTRHHKRRLISKDFLKLLARVMKPGAELRLASDEASYVAWMLKHLQMCSEFFSPLGSDWQKPFADWVTTRYEEKALEEGRIPSYLRFLRNN